MIYFKEYLLNDITKYDNTDDNLYNKIDMYLSNDVNEMLKYIKAIRNVDNMFPNDFIKTSHIIIGTYIYFRLHNPHMVINKKEKMINAINQTNFLENIFRLPYVHNWKGEKHTRWDEVDEYEYDKNLNNIIKHAISSSGEVQLLKKKVNIKLNPDSSVTYKGNKYTNCFENTFLGFIKILIYDLKTNSYNKDLLPNATEEIKSIIKRLNTEDDQIKFNNDFVEVLLDHVNSYPMSEKIKFLKNIDKDGLGNELNLNIDNFKILSIKLLGINLDEYEKDYLKITINKDTIKLNLHNIDFDITLYYNRHGSINSSSNIYIGNYMYNTIITYYNYKNLTPLLYYCRDNYNKQYIKKILKNKDIDINSTENRKAFINIANKYKYDGEKILVLFINHPKFDINLQDTNTNNSNIIIDTIKERLFYAFKLLLEKFEKEIYINIVDNNFYSALMYATKNIYSHDKITCQNIVKLLLAHHNINVNLQNDMGDNALLIACKEENNEIIILLLAHPKINVNLQNDMGDTALILACKNNNNEIIKLLLSNQTIDTCISNKENLNALDYAKLNKNLEIIELIEKYNS
jgi:hypothetical protein